MAAAAIGNNDGIAHLLVLQQRILQKRLQDIVDRPAITDKIEIADPPYLFLIVGKGEGSEFLDLVQGRHQGLIPQFQAYKDLVDVLPPGIPGAYQLNAAQKDKDYEKADTHTGLQSFFGLNKQFPASFSGIGRPKR
jgi:hypothetical protein